MTESIIRFRPAAEADVVLIGAGYDRTSSFGKGADLGPAAILHCLETQLEIYDRVSRSAPAEELSIARVDAGDLAALDPPAMVEALRAVYESHAGRLPRTGRRRPLGLQRRMARARRPGRPGDDRADRRPRRSARGRFGLQRRAPTADSRTRR